MSKVKVTTVTLAAATIIMVAVACPFYANRPKALSISLAEYINAVEEPADVDEPTFNKVLLVRPIEVDCRLRGPFSPNKAFRGKFPEEFRQGAIAYFRLKRRFAKVDTSSGDLSLIVKLVGYEGADGKSPRLAVKVDMKLFNLVTGPELLVGIVESSFLPVTPKKLKKLVRVPVGEKEWILKEGTLTLARICTSIFKRMDEQMVKNRELILKQIQ